MRLTLNIYMLTLFLLFSCKSTKNIPEIDLLKSPTVAVKENENTKLRLVYDENILDDRLLILDTNNKVIFEINFRGGNAEWVDDRVIEVNEILGVSSENGSSQKYRVDIYTKKKEVLSNSNNEN